MTSITASALGPAVAVSGLDQDEAGRFRRVIRLSLPTGGMAERAEVVSSTILNTRFQARNLNALAAGAPEAASLTTSGGQLVLSLPVARLVRSVVLKAPVDGDRIAAFRFDGDAVSEDPVATATHGASGALINVTDASLILKRRNAGDHALSPNAIDEVRLRYLAVNPRLSLRLAGETEEIPFPVKTDADGVSLFPAVASHGAEFATALTSLLSGLSSPLPDPLEFDLILSADEPCSAGIDALALALELQAHALPEKVVLRFAGGQRKAQDLTLMLPTAPATLTGGTLSLALTGTPPDASVIASDPGQPLPAPSGEGLRITDSRPAASLITLPKATAIGAAEVLLAVPGGEARLRAALHQDRNGLPGAALAESSESIVTGARPGAVLFAFDRVAVPAGDVWLSLTVLSGSAVVLLGGNGQIARAEKGNYAVLRDADGRALVARLQSVAPAAGSTAEPTGPVVTLGGEVLPGIPSGGRTAIDLAAALGALPASGPAVLRVSSAARTVVTVDPPLIRYALPA